MLPRYGVVSAVFLLSYAAHLAPRQSLGEWIAAARNVQSFQARATDLVLPAKHLIQLQLATIEERVELASALRAFCNNGDRSTYLGIALLLLSVAPPVWLPMAVSDGSVVREYIPQQELDALEWLEPELDRILVMAWHATEAPRQDDLRKRIGDAAELFLVAAFAAAGAVPIHVAQISDAFGYDIELNRPRTSRIEVKAASPKTKASFHLTRNEYDKCCDEGPPWRIIQIIFSNEAFVAERLNATHIASIRELAADDLASIVPEDTIEFAWTDSAIITPPTLMWRASPVVLDPNFVLPGFSRLQIVDDPVSGQMRPIC